MPRTLVLLAVLLCGRAPAVHGEPPAAAPSGTTPAEKSTTSPEPGDSPASSAKDAVPCFCVTAGDPNIAPCLWQRTWGIIGLTGFFVGDKMAPNGIPYDPLFSLDAQLNVALTADRSWYLFGTSRFWAQKASDGITNGRQGSFDFSKRQFDLDAGMAWNYAGRWEARGLFYSDNNINRGRRLDTPFGFNDGFALENRYYFESTNFDKGLYRFLAVGYCFTKDLIGGDGVLFQPSVYARASLALDLIPEAFYLYADVELITQRTLRAKLLWSDLGVAFRPFHSCPDLEFRLGAETTSDVDVGITRSLFYGHARFVW